MSAAIGWLASALMLIGILVGRREDSLPSALAWTGVLVCLVVVSAWPLNIALCGVVVGGRLAAVVRAAS